MSIVIEHMEDVDMNKAWKHTHVHTDMRIG